MHHAEWGTLQRRLSRWPWGGVGLPWGEWRRRAGFHLPAAVEQEEEESLRCPRKLKSSDCSPMPGRRMRGWTPPGSDAAPCVWPSLRDRQLQRWVVVVGGLPAWHRRPGEPRVPSCKDRQTDNVREPFLLQLGS